MSFEVLVNAYKQAVEEDKPPSGHFQPHVAISKVRDCAERLGLYSADFYELLYTIPRETDKYIIDLASPMYRGTGGVSFNNTYYHFIAVYYKRNGKLMNAYIAPIPEELKEKV